MMSDHFEQDIHEHHHTPAPPEISEPEVSEQTVPEKSELAEHLPGQDTADHSSDQPSNPLRSTFDWLEAAVFSLVLVTLIFSCICRTVGVNGDSMMDTLMDKDRLLLRTNFYTPRHGDVVVVRIPGQQEPLIKRVIGVAGDTVQLDAIHNVIYRNGERLQEPYVNQYPLAYGVQWTDENVDHDGTIHIPEGKIFVLGDHRNLSRDSRDRSVRLIDVEDVMGQAFFRIFPFDKIGTF